MRTILVGNLARYLNGVVTFKARTHLLPWYYASAIIKGNPSSITNSKRLRYYIHSMNYITHRAKQWYLCKRQYYINWTSWRSNIIKLLCRRNSCYIYLVWWLLTIWDHTNIENSRSIISSSIIGYLNKYFILVVKYIALINYLRSLKWIVNNWYPCIIKTIILVENFNSKVNTT